MKLRDTPIKKYGSIWVKREDLCVVSPGPKFSKIRGLYEKMVKLKRQRYKNIGYTETSISMAGWGVAWIAREIGLNAIIFDPQYVNRKILPTHLKVLNKHRKIWKKFDPEIIPYPAGMASVNININRNFLKSKYQNSIMLPLGLPFPETVSATSKIARNIPDKFKSIVISVGSGTICAGVLKGMQGGNLYGIMTRSGNVCNKRKSIIRKSGKFVGGLLDGGVKLKIIDPGWEYTQRSEIKAPFPCNPFYDLKAWEWLIENKHKLENPILFWNIGA